MMFARRTILGCIAVAALTAAPSARARTAPPADELATRSGRPLPPTFAAPAPPGNAPSAVSSRPAGVTPAELDESLALITGNNTPAARRLGARQLMQVGSADALQRLRGVLVAGNDAQAIAAVCDTVAAGRSGPEALAEPLIALLGDPRPGLSDAAIRALETIEGDRVIDWVAAVAADPTRPVERRLPAIRSLATLGDDKRAVAKLVDLVRRASPTLQSAAVAALGDCVFERFTDADDALAWWEANQDTPDAVWKQRFIATLQHRLSAAVGAQSDLTQRVVALARADFLRTSEPERSKALLNLLKDDLPALRELALDLINVWITDRKEIGVEIRTRLGELIDDPDASVRRRVAKIVGDLRLTGEVSRLVSAIGREGVAAVRAAQVDAAGRLEDRTVLPMLLSRLDDDTPAVVTAAAMASANLARRGFGKAEDIEIVSTALLKHYKNLNNSDEALRESLLSAMAVVAAEPMREVFRQELTSGGGPRIRAAAVRALATYRDARAAADIRPLLESPDAPLRLAAVEALGPCGGGEADLTALFGRLDAAREPSAPVREQAWESYKMVAQQAPPAMLLRAADAFVVDGNPAAQQHRLELLRIVEQRAETLDPAERRLLQMRLGDVRMAIGDFKAAATAYDAAQVLTEGASDSDQRSAVLLGANARLRAGDDDDALSKLSGLLGDSPEPPADATSAPVRDLLIAELRRRATSADAAGTLRLLNKIDPLAGKLGESYAADAQVIRAEAQALRDSSTDADIDRLVGQVGTSPDAERRLLELGPRALARIHARLTRTTTTAASRPTEAERRLVALASRIDPKWTAYTEEATAAQRDTALAELAARAGVQNGNGAATNGTDKRLDKPAGSQPAASQPAGAPAK